MLILVIRSLLLYLLVIFALRLMGKKQLGELQPAELVSTILISNIATLSLEDPNLPMLAGVVPIMMIVALDVLMSVASLKNLPVRRLLSGRPRVVIRDGNIDQKEMRNLRYTVDDLFEAMRDGGLFDLAKVQYAVVETTGKINFFERPAGGETGRAEDPPVLIIKDGELCKDGIEELGVTEAWIRQTLFENDCAVSQAFLMTASRDGKYNLVTKN